MEKSGSFESLGSKPSSSRQPSVDSLSSASTSDRSALAKPPSALSSDSMSTSTEFLQSSGYVKPKSTAKEPAFMLDMPLGVVRRVDIYRTQREVSYTIICKDTRNFQFLQKHRMDPLKKSIFDVMPKFAFPVSNGLQLFAFHYDQPFPENGWKVYDALAEYKRQGIPNESWRITKVNDRYELCETYLQLWLVPVNIPDDELKRWLPSEEKGEYL
ncbi:Myotubularin-related protein 2, partial [Oryzias melastigma]